MSSLIERDLDRERKNSFESTKTKKAEEMKLLMEGNVIDERNILRDAGLDFNIREVEKKVGVNMMRKKKEDSMGSKVFTEDEIRSACIRYDLRFLNSKLYKGTIEPTLGATLLKFFNERNIDSRSYEASTNLYIMAPKKAFNLEERPNPPVLDPVMFYKMHTSEGDMYALVHKWGKDFTIFRRILGAARETSWHWFWFKSVLFFVLSTLAIAAFGFNPLSIPLLVLSVALGGLFSLISHSIIIGDDSRKWDNWRKSFSRESWNSIYKD